MIDPQTTPPENAPHAMRVALAHDWLVGYRGGEMVLDAIARLLLSQGHTISRIYTMFDNAAPLSPTLDALPRATSALNRYPESLRRWLLPRYPAAVAELGRALARDHAREPIDLLISTSSSAIKSIAPPAGVPHLCYCHSPARYLWSQTDSYASPDLKGRLRALGLASFAPAPRLGPPDRDQCLSLHRQLHPHRTRDRTLLPARLGRHPPARANRFLFP
ncbi:MAG: hypothetical protein R3B67_09240 [Phycisphaerales bacterium]